ncbi:hypothetical protein OB69_05340 [Roseivirga seohaensis subsp. aquiponti]|uniref:Peptidase S9 prolyl oligopeptidase catalytic domain-containing protein n=1 Tax=Roseivirga seohaensis subsp. aquiponti TaxID=1566026 RepID=A0A0L8AML5_9BACT|nr:alpha/beta fold hydrolase [Roseivirga seohaensis]KOF03713.1 hypothetical protein OB69_05340 [Roseivirga seohaensis subsp. aquiponti]
MLRKFLGLILLISPFWSLAQSLSGFQVNDQATHLVYVENNDILYLKELNSDKKPTLIGKGLSDSENDILRSWNKNGDIFIYEKSGDFYYYSVETGETNQIELADAFSLFKYYRINQVAATDQALYFSARNETSDKNFSLYKLDLKGGKAIKLLELEGDVANIALSRDSNLLAFTSYQYLDEQYQNRLHILNLKEDAGIVSSHLMKNAFYSNLSFSNDGRISLRNMNGSAFIAEYDQSEAVLNIEELEMKSGQQLLGFKENNYLVLSLNSSGKSYTLLDTSLNMVHELSGNSNLLLVDYLDDEFYFTEESGILPKSLFKLNPMKGDKQQIISFKAENLLADIQYEILTYYDQSGKGRNAFLYYPKRHNSGQFPTILMNYGGYANKYPDWSYFLNQLIFPMLDEGFGVVLLNTRGVNSERLGEGYGQYQLEDTEHFIDQFKGEIPVDFDRLIPVGHSHGATMVYYYLTHSKSFVSGIAINGAADWVEQAKLERMTGLPGEMGGKPDELPKLYQKFSPIENISSDLNPMLIFSGGQDEQIPYNINSKAFAEKALELEVDVEYIHFEDQGHIFEDPAIIEQMRKKLRDFLLQWKHN